MDSSSPSPNETKPTTKVVKTSETTKSSPKMVRKKIKWKPLESNPDVMNKYLKKLGLVSPHAIEDVWSLDPTMLSFHPQPVQAVIFLFDINEKLEKIKMKQNEEMKKNPAKYPPELFFTRQTIGNACGTIALLHSLFNNFDRITVQKGSFLEKYYNEAKSLNPDQRAERLEYSDSLAESHQSSASTGQTKAPSEDEKINLHFNAFVNHKGVLYELDGRKLGPINHGKCTDVLSDAIKIFKEQFIVTDPTSNNWTALTFGAPRE